MTENVLYAFLLTMGAGLATGIGSCIAFFAKQTSKKFLSFSLGFSAGVMVYVSFMEILHTARVDLAEVMGAKAGDVMTVACFFGGMAIAAFIDKMVPSVENPHEIRSVEEMSDESHKQKKLSRMGMMAALAIGIHNFPEGIASFMTAVESPKVGIAIAAAIAIHNIPEGIAVSVPIFFATGSKKKAFWYSFLSGLAEPVGALVAFLLLMPFMSVIVLNSTFAAVAGIMVYISFDELLPAAREYGEHHISIYGLLSGMLVMAISLLWLT